MIDWEEEEDRVAPRYLAAGDPTGWFDELYEAGAGAGSPCRSTAGTRTPGDRRWRAEFERR